MIVLPVLIMLAATWLSPDSAVAAEHKSKPNILFILTDDQRLEDIKHMPRLNKLLVNQGMSFENYFSTVSLCCPSRTSILRGQYAHNTGVMTNGGNNGGFVVAHKRGIENSTIATWMHDRGYTTALIGKYLNHYPDGQGLSYVPPGWDYWASPCSGNPYTEYNYDLNENGKSVHYGNTPSDYGTDVYLHKATDFIKSCSGENKPFFMYLAFYAPHGPATPADRHLNMFADAKIVRTKAFNESDVSNKPDYIKKLNLLTDKEVNGEDAYYGKRLRSLQAVDEAIEKLYDTLSENKQLDNTYIFFASDNGFHLGEHRMRRGKQTAYETDIHLPLIVRGPGITHGATAAELVGNIDLAPTWADLAGATAPQFVDGRSLQPILRAKEGKSLKWRQAYLVEHWTVGKGNASPPPETTTKGGEKPIASTEKSAGGGEPIASSGPPQAAGASLEPPAATHEETIKTESTVIEELDTYQIAKEDSPTTPAAPAASDSKPDASSGAGNSNQSQDLKETPNRPRRRRARPRQGGGGEMGGIPEYHALRSPDSTYVEYVTGEREFYKLTDDPDQINNLATQQKDTLKPLSDQLKEMRK